MSAYKMRPSSAEALGQRSLSALEGLWKVVHHGNLVTPVYPEKTPRLTVYFRKLVNQENPTQPADFETTGSAEALSIPAAELMRLPLNVVVRNSRLAKDPCLPLPSELMDEIHVDISSEKIRLFSRYAQSYEGEDFIIPYKVGRSPPPNSDGSKAYYVAIEHQGDPFGVVIPSTEIFRFFYCTSSRMANTILSDRILDVDHYIIDPARSGVANHDPEVAVVWLRQWMLNSDRRHIARLLFTPGAFEEAKNIFMRASGFIEPIYARALIARPPLHGPLSLKCIFKHFHSEGRQRIFVTRLISTNWKLPFREIHFGRDNDGRRVASDEERDSLPDHNRHQRPKVLDEGAEIKMLDDTPGDNSIDPFELSDVEFSARFPDLEKIYSPQIDKICQETKNNQGKKLLSLANGTLVEGSSTEHEGLVNTILQAMEDKANIQKEKKKADQGFSTLLEEAHSIASSKLFERINHIEKALADDFYSERLTVSYMPVLETTGLILGKLLNILPRSFDGKVPAWLFLDHDKRHPRPVLVVSLALDGRKRYLIDFMHKEGHSDTASLLLWHREEESVPDHLLEYAIRTCIRNGAINLKDGDLLKDYCGRPLKHTFSEKSPKPQHQQLIEKIFAGKNRMSKWISGAVDSPQN